MLTFYQVYSVRKSVYGFELPGDLSRAVAFFQALSFDVGTFIFPSWTCIGGLTARLAFSGLWPVVLLLAVTLGLLALEVARKGDLQRARMRSLEAAVFISFCVLPSVTRSLFLAFQCESFGFDDFASPPESKLYLSEQHVVTDGECARGGPSLHLLGVGSPPPLLLVNLAGASEPLPVLATVACNRPLHRILVGLLVQGRVGRPHGVLTEHAVKLLQGNLLQLRMLAQAQIVERQLLRRRRRRSL